MKTHLAAALAASLLCSTAAGHAATIETEVSPDGVVQTVLVYGDIVDGDDREFISKTANFIIRPGLKYPVVILKSPGGLTKPALAIGRMIHERGYTTYVSAGDMCASACALIWIAGGHQLMDPSAKIGFHAVYTKPDGVKTVSSTGNAVVGSYLGSLGLSDAAITFATSAPPESIQWMSFDDARLMGLKVSLNKSVPVTPPQPLPVLSSQPTTLQPMPTVETPAPAPVDPVFASLSADRQEMVTSLAAEVTRLLKDGGIARVNREIEACYAIAMRSKTVKAVQRCAALDIAATSITYALKIDSPYNTYDALGERGALLRRVVALPTSRVEESNSIAIATVNLIAGVVSK